MAHIDGLAGRVGRLVGPAARAIGAFFDGGAIDTVARLETFVGSRAPYVAQNQLFGHLKSLECGRFRDFFEEGAQAAALRSADEALCASCLADLSVFAAANVANGADIDANALARRCFRSGIERVAFKHSPSRRRRIEDDFDARLGRTSWDAPSDRGEAFHRSAMALVDQLEILLASDSRADASVGQGRPSATPLDRERLSASMHAAWRRICDQLDRRLDSGAIAAAITAKSR